MKVFEFGMALIVIGIFSVLLKLFQSVEYSWAYYAWRYCVFSPVGLIVIMGPVLWMRGWNK